MYAMYMGLHINNPEVEKCVRELSAATGESVTHAIGIAAAERMERLRSGKTPGDVPRFEELMAMIRSYNLQPINQDLTDDEILGFGPDGIPE